MRRRALALAVAVAALGVPAAANGIGPMHGGPPPAGVSILFDSSSPPTKDVLVGDTVMWTNDSLRAHTVSALDGTWSSAHLVGGDMFERRFDAPGAIAYYCQIHPFMRGEIDVHRLLLTAPTEPGAPGHTYALHGRAATAPGGAVEIQADSGAGFQPVASATVGPDGAFEADIVPRATATYRAAAGDDTSPPVQLVVLDRKLMAAARTHRGRAIVTAAVAPASPGATVVLQLRLRERFGWWPVARARLDRRSRARLMTRLHRRVPARVVLTLADGATPLATSRILRVGGR